MSRWREAFLGSMPARYEYDYLATYNAEVARGIVHTDEWKARMREEQRRFDDRNRPQPSREGPEDPAPGS